MFNNIAIDVALGLVFIYLLYSLLATILQELIAQYLELRPRMLLRSIAVMLDREGGEPTSAVEGFWGLFAKFRKKVVYPTADKFYEQGSIKFLKKGEKNVGPSEITDTNFADTLIRMLSTSDGTIPNINQQLQKINEALSNKELISDDETRTLLKNYLAEAGNDIEAFKEKLKTWYNETQLRVIGWYKRQTQYILLVIGILLAVGNNVDSISIYKILSTNSQARAQLTEMAVAFKQSGIYEKAIGKDMPIADDEARQKRIDELNAHYREINKVAAQSQLVLGLGYNSIGFFGKIEKTLSRPTNVCKWQHFKNIIAVAFRKFIGWFITALMISLGAPFWFDLLNKMMQLRSSKKEDTSMGKTTSQITPNPSPVTTTVNLNNAAGAVG